MVSKNGINVLLLTSLWMEDKKFGQNERGLKIKLLYIYKNDYYGIIRKN